MLRANEDRDVYLRHAGVMALTGILRRVAPTPNDPFLSRKIESPEATRLQKAFNQLMTDSNSAVRMSALLALRRIESPDIAQFLQDAESLLVAEAARAINDIPIPAALPQLAALINDADKLGAFPAGDEKMPGPRDGLIRRVMNANFRLGRTNNAAALAAFATTSPVRDTLRAEAITMLGEWAEPSVRDRISGLWRPLEKRDPEVAAVALQPHLPALLKSSSNKLKLETTKTASVLNIKSDEAQPIALVLDTNAAPNLRVEALKSMARGKDEKLAEAVRLALADSNEALRKEAARIQAQLQPDDAMAQLRSALEQGSVGDKQNAFATLGTLNNEEADTVILQWLDKLLAKNVPPELTLDLIDAAAKREAQPVKDRLRKFELSRPAADDLRAYRECMVGGDAEEGKKVFIEKVEASCVRCHKFKGEGGEVGPDLTGMGGRKDRQLHFGIHCVPQQTHRRGIRERDRDAKERDFLRRPIEKRIAADSGNQFARRRIDSDQEGRHQNA